MAPRLAILFDCDNTLLDNDALKEELNSRLVSLLGEQDSERFWEVYEAVRAERTVVDVPLTIERYAGEDERQPHQLRSVFFDFPFADFVFPAVPRVIAHGKAMGSVAVLSDGDQVFQRHKIRQSGLDEMVGGAVYVFDHKEIAIPRLVAEIPADRYVTVDDKPALLGALKAAIGAPLTTVFVRQGKYARAGGGEAEADFTLDSIGDFVNLTKAQLASGSSA